MEKIMLSATYAEPKTFFPFGDNKIVAFLNEETVENWKQDNTPEDAPAITGYRYTGPRKDGGTLLPCTDPENYGCLTDAIICSRYSKSEEMAIHRHYQNSFEEYQEEWQEYNQFCEYAKTMAKKWLGIS